MNLPNNLLQICRFCIYRLVILCFAIAFLSLGVIAKNRVQNVKSFAVYVFVDMEGCSGITNREQILSREGGLRMAEDINACVQGCFNAGATYVIVRDGHGGGKNVDPTLIDKRAKLIQGSTPNERFPGGIDSCRAVILLGYHAMALTPNAFLAHSYSSATIQSITLNGKLTGEIGIDATIASEHDVPVVMVSGDDKCCHEAKKWIPNVVTCEVKKAITTLSAESGNLEKMHKLIESKTKEALLSGKHTPVKNVSYPAKIKWEYLPEGSPRVYALDFKRVVNPRIMEKSSDRVEKILLNKD